jgi:hypothetical protein
MRTRTSIVLAAGLALTVILLGATLSHVPLVVARTNALVGRGEITEIKSNARVCQASEAVPAGTSAIRIGFNMALGAHMAVAVTSGAQLITHGVRASGWRGTEVTVPLHRVARAVQHATVCATLGKSNEPVGVFGAPSSAAMAATRDGHALPGRVKLEYLRAGTRSWWSMASSVGRRLGLGRAWSGGWISLLVLTLMGSIVVIASWLAIRVLP